VATSEQPRTSDMLITPIGEVVATTTPLGAVEEQKVRQSSLARDAVSRLLRNRLAIVGFAFILLLFVCAVFANVIAPYNFAEKVPGEFYRTTPNSWFIFGTDNNARDVFSRIIYGARASVIVGFGTVLLELLIGVTVGAFAGYFSGNTDNILMRVVDITATVPPLLIAILLLVARGPGIANIILALGITSWVTIARLTRGQMLTLRELDYIKASRTAGAGGAYIVLRHLLPNSLTPLIVAVTFAIPEAIFGEAFLSFIGIGIRPPNPSWGQMVAEGQQYLQSTPHLAIIPVLCLMLTLLAFRFFGDGLRDALDPKGNN